MARKKQNNWYGKHGCVKMSYSGVFSEKLPGYVDELEVRHQRKRVYLICQADFEFNIEVIYCVP